MVNMVSVQPFTRYQLVQELIQQSEHLFTEVSQLGRSAQVGTAFPLRTHKCARARARSGAPELSRTLAVHELMRTHSFCLPLADQALSPDGGAAFH